MKNTTTGAAMELLSPAGDRECLRAAVANGADAVYFGLSGFNARGRAVNFTLEELPEVTGFCHDRNVRAYVAINTLVLPGELAEVARYIEAAARAGADAVIVQDLGVAALARRIAPSLPLHASTQMTLSEAEGIEQVKELGIRRVILARELSVEQVRDIHARTEVELEVFVHGAICISYSGQCAASLARGGRSANRGQCAQPCRLEYDLLIDGADATPAGRRHLMSPSDLGAWRLLPELGAAGVSAVKIEGRLRSAEYVAAVTDFYRGAIDAAAKGEEFVPSAEQTEAMEYAFGRRLTEGFLGRGRGEGGDSPRRTRRAQREEREGETEETEEREELVDGRSPGRRGRELGRVARVGVEGVVVELEEEAQIAAGDGLAFGWEGVEEGAAGGRVYSAREDRGEGGRAEEAGRRMEVRFGKEGCDLGKVSEGMRVWKTDDPAVGRRLRATYGRVEVMRREKLWVRVEAREGRPLTVEMRDESGRRCRVEEGEALSRAERRPVTEAWVREQMDRFGETPFEVGELELECGGGQVMVPASAMNRARRRGVEELMKLRGESVVHAARAEGALEEVRREWGREGHGDAATRRRGEGDTVDLSVVARTMEQVEEAVRWGRARVVYADLRETERFGEAVGMIRRGMCYAGLATPRAVGPGQEGVWERVVEAAPDAVRVRSVGALRYLKGRLKGVDLVGDVSLNAVNDVSAAVLARWGAARVVPGFDLDANDLATLGRGTPVEALVYYRMPLFYTKHCLYAAHLGGGLECGRCGRPCREHRLALRDRMGQELPVMVDAAGGNTVLAEVTAVKAGTVRRWREAGVMNFAVELTTETAGQVAGVLDAVGGMMG